MSSSLRPSLVALALAATVASVAVAAPLTFTHQGRLFDAAGGPLNGAYTIAFALYDAPTGGAALWSEPHTVQVENGYYAVVLGSSSALDPSDFDSEELYIGVAVDGAPPLARTQLHSVPWALRANTATNVDGGIVNASEIRINGNSLTAPSSGLLFNLELNETSGTTFADTSGGGNDAVAPSGGIAAGSVGHSGRGINFSGGLVRVNSGNSISDSPYISTEAWLRPALPLTGDKVILQKVGAYSLTQTGDKIRFDITAANGTCSVTSTRPITAGEYSRVQGSYNGMGVSILVDTYQIQEPCSNGPLIPTLGGELAIGAANDGTATYDGIIDEVRVWSTPTNVFTQVDAIVTGGTLSNVGSDNVHTFTQSGVFSTNVPLTVDVLLVAGGGGGGQHSTTNGNGGGGGGGVISQTSFEVNPGAYSVTVGEGGQGWPRGTQRAGVNGGNSVFSTLTAIGGGGGGAQSSPAGGGGSGGGGSQNFGTPGTGTSGQGYPGGIGSFAWTGGGGGGAGGPGVRGGNGGTNGNGGVGVASSISGATLRYGGGGGGGGNSSERAGDGFDGGGRGQGTTSYYAHTTFPDVVNAITNGHGQPDGIPNTGGGGGGGTYWTGSAWTAGSGTGGSGIVIIRYTP